MKLTSLDEIIDEHIGTKETINRKVFDTKLTLHSIALQLKEIRKARNITQQQLAEMIGKDKTQISKIERGTRNLTIETIMQIANALNVDISVNININENKFAV